MQINAITQKPYTGTNAKTLEAACMPSNVWATYKQWQSIHQQVRKGSHGIRLVRVDGKKIIPMNVFNQSQVDQIDDANNFAIAAIASQVAHKAPEPIEAHEPAPQATPKPVKVSTPKTQNKPQTGNLSQFKAFIKAINDLAKIIEKRASVEVLKCVKIHWVLDGIILTGVNIVSGSLIMQIKLDIKTNQFDPMLFNIESLQSFTKAIKGPNIELSFSPEGIVLNGFKLKAIDKPASDFPNIDIGKPLSKINLHTESVKSVIHCVSRDETRHYLNGVYIHYKGGNLVSVATDGHRLARYTLASDAFDFDLILPHNACKAIAGLPDGILSKYQSHIQFTSGNYTITSYLIDGTFPDYERVIPEPKECTGITINRAELLESVTRLNPVAKTEPKIAILKLDFENKIVSGGGLELPFNYEGEQILFNIGYNGLLLHDALKAADRSQVSILIKDSRSPTSIIAGDLLQVVMPLRI